MLRVGEDSARRSGLDDLALGITQTRSAMWRTMPRSWVMSSIAMPYFGLQVLQQFQDLRLHRHVKRRGGLVGDQQVGIVGKRHGDHDALPLAAGQLMRIILQAAFPGRGCRLW